MPLMLKYLIIGAIIVALVIWLRRLFAGRPKEPFAPDRPKVLPPADGGAVAAEIDGQELEIDSAILAEVRALADQGRTIEAIARLREATGLDLGRAKDIVESLDRMRGR
jgi:ribosomal protein L7/L12